MSDCYYLHLTPLFDPLWHELEGEYLAYDRASGATHCFDIITAELLMKLLAGPASVNELIAHIAENLHLDIGDDLAVHVSNSLRELRRNAFVDTTQQS